MKEITNSRANVTPENRTGAPPQVDRGRQSIVPPPSAPASAVKPQMGKNCNGKTEFASKYSQNADLL